MKKPKFIRMVVQVTDTKFNRRAMTDMVLQAQKRLIVSPDTSNVLKLEYITLGQFLCNNPKYNVKEETK